MNVNWPKLCPKICNISDSRSDDTQISVERLETIYDRKNARANRDFYMLCEVVIKAFISE